MQCTLYNVGAGVAHVLVAAVIAHFTKLTRLPFLSLFFSSILHRLFSSNLSSFSYPTCILSCIFLPCHWYLAGCSANSTYLLTFSIKASQYLDHLGEQPLIGVTVLAYVKSTQQSWIKKLTYRLLLPEVDINIDGKGVLDSLFLFISK